MQPWESVLASAGPGQAQGGEPADMRPELAGTLTPTCRHLAGADYQRLKAAGGRHGRADRRGHRVAAPPAEAVRGALKKKLGLTVEAPAAARSTATRRGQGSRTAFGLYATPGRTAPPRPPARRRFLLSPSLSPEHPCRCEVLKAADLRIQPRADEAFSTETSSVAGTESTRSGS
jgi:hypothetical protein